MSRRVEIHSPERLQKVDELRQLGIDPYPVSAFAPSHSISQALAHANSLCDQQQRVRLAGRIVSHRQMGKRVIFLHLSSSGDRIQAYLRRSNLSDRDWQTIQLLDLGDFLGIEGTMMRTNSGELSVLVDNIAVLCKPTRPVPLPKQRQGQIFNPTTDPEFLLRNRHVRFLSDPAFLDIIRKRTAVIKGIREYLDEEGFLEVETPIIGAYYGGAAARPFESYLNARDENVFLRISPECNLKRLLVAGFERVYELGKNFRNEGMDGNHNPEFTMVEWYEANSDYLHQMARFETLVAGLSLKVNGTTQITYCGRSLNLTPPWRRLPMLDALKEFADVDLSQASDTDLPEIFQQYHPEGLSALPEPLSWGTAVVALFEARVEPHLWDPVFVMDHPVEISPLTKRHRKDARLVERFEPVLAGMEVGNAYSELNDPVEQLERLLHQDVNRDQQYDLDEDFVTAIAHGMPQAGGTGLGVDRVVMILTGAKSIRDVMCFPFVGARNVNTREAALLSVSSHEENHHEST